MNIPPPTFVSILQIHQIQALLNLGLIPDPMTGEPREPNPAVARHELSLLRILERKTRGNLEPEEQRLLSESIGALAQALAPYTDPAEATPESLDTGAATPKKRRIVLPGEPQDG
ncbi:MAG: DUF1844 domain-containing protein [Sumerlaeia bacterium]